MGFNASQAYTSIFIKNASHTFFVILIYVDDIIITRNSDSAINALISSLDQQFSIKDLGPFYCFLGTEVQYTDHGLHLSQVKYIPDLLIKTEMLEYKPFQTRMTSSPFPSL